MEPCPEWRLTPKLICDKEQADEKKLDKKQGIWRQPTRAWPHLVPHDEIAAI